MARPSYPSDKKEQFMVRLPAGMRDRIAAAAERNGRSMNAEIVQALEMLFPPEPSVEEVLDSIHSAIELAHKAEKVPYRADLVKALEGFGARLSTGLDFDRSVPIEEREDFSKANRERSDAWRRRWRRAKEHGVDYADLKQELESGLLNGIRQSLIVNAIYEYAKPDYAKAMQWLGLSHLKFAEPEKSHKLIEKHVRAYVDRNNLADLRRFAKRKSDVSSKKRMDNSEG